MVNLGEYFNSLLAFCCNELVVNGIGGVLFILFILYPKYLLLNFLLLFKKSSTSISFLKLLFNLNSIFFDVKNPVVSYCFSYDVSFILF